MLLQLASSGPELQDSAAAAVDMDKGNVDAAGTGVSAKSRTGTESTMARLQHVSLQLPCRFNASQGKAYTQ